MRDSVATTAGPADEELASGSLAGDLASDLLEGAEAIGAYLNKDARAVYHIASRQLLPIFKIGSVLHARKSRLAKAIEELEGAPRGGVA